MNTSRRKEKAVSPLKAYIAASGVRVSAIMERTGIPQGTMYAYLGGSIPSPGARYALRMAIGDITNREVSESDLWPGVVFRPATQIGESDGQP